MGTDALWELLERRRLGKILQDHLNNRRTRFPSKALGTWNVRDFHESQAAISVDQRGDRNLLFNEGVRNEVHKPVASAHCRLSILSRCCLTTSGALAHLEINASARACCSASFTIEHALWTRPSHTVARIFCSFVAHSIAPSMTISTGMPRASA